MKNPTFGCCITTYFEVGVEERFLRRHFCLENVINIPDKNLRWRPFDGEVLLHYLRCAGFKTVQFVSVKEKPRRYTRENNPFCMVLLLLEKYRMGPEWAGEGVNGASRNIALSR